MGLCWLRSEVSSQTWIIYFLKRGRFKSTTNKTVGQNVVKVRSFFTTGDKKSHCKTCERPNSPKWFSEVTWMLASVLLISVGRWMSI